MKTIEIKRTPTTFLIPADDLRAAFQCASKEKARYYIQGVFVTQTGTGVKLVGTDGHVMLVIDAPDAAFIGAECFTQSDGFILHTDPADKALKAKTAADLWIYGDTQTGILQFVDFAPAMTDAPDAHETWPRVGVCEFEQIDGTFPDWTRVEAKPTGLGGCPFVSLDPTIFAKLVKAADVFEKGKGIRIIPTKTETDAYRVEFEACGHMVGTLMPLRW